MARSYKKHPGGGGPSAKWWKTSANRKLRHKVKQALYEGVEDRELLPIMLEIADPWDSPKDGAGWMSYRAWTWPTHRWEGRIIIGLPCRMRDWDQWLDDSWYRLFYRK